MCREGRTTKIEITENDEMKCRKNILFKNTYSFNSPYLVLIVRLLYKFIAYVYCHLSSYAQRLGLAFVADASLVT
jgi:hypothetical protein